MGRLLQYREKDDKWCIWSTISDSEISEWLKADDIKALLAQEHKTEYQLEVIKLYLTFPHGYYDKGSYKRLFNSPGVDNYHMWYLKVLDTYDDPREEIEKKYKELTGE